MIYIQICTAEQTAKFVEIADKLFDYFNVSSFSQGKKKRKPFQQSYRNKPDFDKDPDFRFKVIIIAFYHFYHLLLIRIAVSERSADILR